MYLNYKLKNPPQGVHLRAFAEWDLLIDEANHKKFNYKDISVSKTIEINGIKYDHVNYDVGLYTDADGRYYFKDDGEKIYYSDFEYIDPYVMACDKSLLKDMPLDMFAASIFKNAKRLLFMEPRWTLIDGVYHKTKVPCEIQTIKTKETTYYGIETVSLDDFKTIYYYDIRDFYEDVKNGLIKLDYNSRQDGIHQPYYFKYPIDCDVQNIIPKFSFIDDRVEHIKRVKEK